MYADNKCLQDEDAGTLFEIVTGLAGWSAPKETASLIEEMCNFSKEKKSTEEQFRFLSADLTRGVFAFPTKIFSLGDGLKCKTVLSQR